MAVKKRIGRPPKAEKERKAVNFTFRSRGQMRERLQEAATASGRSISEEIEHRLEESFRSEELYGGPGLSAVFRALSAHIAVAKTQAGDNWEENDQARSRIAQVFADLLATGLPRFYSVMISTSGNYGEVRSTVGYASEEIAKKESPGFAEFLRRRREAVA